MQKRFKILLATDYSKASSIAEKYAIQLAKSTNSAIRIIHVYETPLIPTTLNQIDFYKALEEFKDSELIRLENHCNAILKSLNLRKDDLNFECVVREGNVTSQAMEEAIEWFADFIVAGTHGATGFRDVLFGTQTWGLIKESIVPVLAIPKEAVFKEIKNIVFASEQRDGEIPAINFMVQFAKEFDAQLTVLHVADHFLSREFEIEMFDNFIKDVNNKLSFENLILKLVFHENVIKGITEFCSKEKTDWLVVSYEKPSLLEKIVVQDFSTTKKISFQANIPVFCIPDHYNPQHMDVWNELESEEINS